MLITHDTYPGIKFFNMLNIQCLFMEWTSIIDNLEVGIKENNAKSHSSSGVFKNFSHFTK